MIKLDRILVPTDFSDFSQPAMLYGCAMAERFEAELHLLHVVPDPAMLVPEAAAFSVETMQAQSGSLVKDALATLQKLPASSWDNK